MYLSKSDLVKLNLCFKLVVLPTTLKVTVVLKIYSFSPTSAQFCEDSHFKIQSPGYKKHSISLLNSIYTSSTAYLLQLGYQVSLRIQRSVPVDTRGKRMNMEQLGGAT